MNHPDLDALTADADDAVPAEEREGIREHLDACPACLELYSGICAERAVIESSRPPREWARPLAMVGLAVVAAGAAWLASGSVRPPSRSPHDSILLLASPATRAQAAAELLRMGPSALAALERGARGDDAAVSRACQDLLLMIAAQDPADTRTLVSAVEQKWKEIEEAFAEGNPWVDKKDFDHPFEEWKKAQGPDAAALEAAEKAILAWFEAGKKPTGLEWRVRRLLSQSARERKDLAAAATQLDRAIAAYPGTSYTIPSKHSKFQHLVNDRAMMIWDEKGVDAAIGYVVDLLSKDRRFHYFYSWPWDRRFEDEKTPAVRAAMVERIRAAYVARAAKYPDLAEETKKHSAELK